MKQDRFLVLPSIIEFGRVQINIFDLFNINIVSILFLIIYPFFAFTLNSQIGKFLIPSANLLTQGLIGSSFFAAIGSILVSYSMMNFHNFLVLYAFIQIALVLSLISNKNYVDFKVHLKQFMKYFLIYLILIFFVLLPFFVENLRNFDNALLFNAHQTYYSGQVIEMLTGSYPGRLRVYDQYPLTWAKYHFFQSSLISIVFPNFHFIEINYISYYIVKISIVCMIIGSIFIETRFIKSLTKIVLFLLISNLFLIELLNYSFLTNNIIPGLVLILIYKSYINREFKLFYVLILINMVLVSRNVILSISLLFLLLLKINILKNYSKIFQNIFFFKSKKFSLESWALIIFSFCLGLAGFVMFVSGDKLINFNIVQIPPLNIYSILDKVLPLGWLDILPGVQISQEDKFYLWFHSLSFVAFCLLIFVLCFKNSSVFLNSFFIINLVCLLIVFLFDSIFPEKILMLIVLISLFNYFLIPISLFLYIIPSDYRLFIFISIIPVSVSLFVFDGGISVPLYSTLYFVLVYQLTLKIIEKGLFLQHPYLLITFIASSLFIALNLIPIKNIHQFSINDSTSHLVPFDKLISLHKYDSLCRAKDEGLSLAAAALGKGPIYYDSAMSDRFFLTKNFTSTLSTSSLLPNSCS